MRPPLPKLPERELEFHSAPAGVSGWLNQARLAFALPWRQISDGSVMAFTVSFGKGVRGKDMLRSILMGRLMRLATQHAVLLRSRPCSPMPPSHTHLQLSGALPDVPQGRFSSAMSMPLLTEALKKAAADPRIRGIAVKIDPLSIGWAKLQVGH